MPPLGMSRNLKITLAYRGANFHGWQIQPGMRTAQGELTDALQRLLRHPLTAHGASRTDAGVHAQGQVASVLTESTIPLAKLRRALADRLPDDMALIQMDETPAGFHASHSALGKLYRYRIHNHSVRPVERLEAENTWHVWHALDTKPMQAAARLLTGTHDFAGFASAGSQPRRTTVRTITRFDVRRWFRQVVLDVAGDGFLYNQVRNMVGTLVEIGRGHWPVERVSEVLAACDRRLAGPTAPPQGLCLQWVRYAAWPDDDGAGPKQSGTEPDSL